MTVKRKSPWLRDYVQKRSDKAAVTTAAVDVDLTNGAAVDDGVEGIGNGNDTGETTGAVTVLSGDPNANNPEETTGENAEGKTPAPAEVITEDVTEIDNSVEDKIEDVIGSGDPNAHTPMSEGDKTEVDTPDTDATGNPWDDARTHADIDETVPVGADLPEDWKSMTLAEKRAWLDANHGV